MRNRLPLVGVAALPAVAVFGGWIYLAASDPTPDYSDLVGVDPDAVVRKLGDPDLITDQGRGWHFVVERTHPTAFTTCQKSISFRIATGRGYSRS
jgi:hypothetical protein